MLLIRYDKCIYEIVFSALARIIFQISMILKYDVVTDIILMKIFSKVYFPLAQINTNIIVRFSLVYSCNISSYSVLDPMDFIGQSTNYIENKIPRVDLHYTCWFLITHFNYQNFILITLYFTIIVGNTTDLFYDLLAHVNF